MTYLDQISQNVDADLNHFFQEDQVVEWNTLNKLAYYHPYRIGPGVECIRLKQGRTGMLFLTTYDHDGAEIYEHEHDCYEWIQVVAGQITDVTTGNVYTPGDMVYLKPGQTHHPVGTKGTILYVEFRKANIIGRILNGLAK